MKKIRIPWDSLKQSENVQEKITAQDMAVFIHETPYSVSGHKLICATGSWEAASKAERNFDDSPVPIHGVLPV